MRRKLRIQLGADTFELDGDESFDHHFVSVAFAAWVAAVKARLFTGLTSQELADALRVANDIATTMERLAEQTPEPPLASVAEGATPTLDDNPRARKRE